MSPPPWITVLSLVVASAEEVTIIFMNAVEDGGAINIYYAGVEGRGVVVADGATTRFARNAMVCVGSVIRAGFEVEVGVGSLHDQYVVSRTPCEVGHEYPRMAGATWAHERWLGATVAVLGEEPEGFFLSADLDYARAAGKAETYGVRSPLLAIGAYLDEEEDVARLAWQDGLGYLYREPASTERERAENFAGARRSLNLAAALGDETAGTVASLATLAGVLPPSPGFLAQTSSVARHVVRVRKYKSWLARLALGSWRSGSSTGRLARDCPNAVESWLELLRDVAAPGATSPLDALAKPRHALYTQTTQLSDLWMRADVPATWSEGSATSWSDEVYFDGEYHRFATDARELGRRALRGDGHAALNLGVLLTDGALPPAYEREAAAAVGAETPAAAAAEYFRLAAANEQLEPDAAAALAELLLGGHDGVDPDVDVALDLVSRKDTTPFGHHIRGHILAEALRRPAAAREAFETALAKGYADAAVSLAVLCRRQGEDLPRAKRLLRSSFEDQASLTAAFVLADLLYHDEANCTAAERVLAAAVSGHAWDAQDGGFGISDALADAQRALTSHWRFARSKCNSSRTPGFDVAALSARVSCRGNVEPTLTGAYRMFATLAEAGVRAAHLNAGFLARHLAIRGQDSSWNRFALGHYRFAAKRTPADDFFASDDILDSHAHRLKALELAEGIRGLADCRANKWPAACDTDNRTCADLRDDYKAAALAGSEWAHLSWAFYERQAGTSAADAADIVLQCATRFDWPYTAPCWLYASLLQMYASVLQVTAVLTRVRRFCAHWCPPLPRSVRPRR